MKANLYILLLGSTGIFLPGLLYTVFNNSLGDTRLVLNKAVIVLSATFIWLIYFRSAFKWNDKNIVFIIATMIHSLFWSFVLLVAYFAGGGGILA